MQALSQLSYTPDLPVTKAVELKQITLSGSAIAVSSETTIIASFSGPLQTQKHGLSCEELKHRVE